MATKPERAPEVSWLVMLLQGKDLRMVMTSDNKQACLECIAEARAAGHPYEYFIFAADSTHRQVVSNEVYWQRPQGII